MPAAASVLKLDTKRIEDYLRTAEAPELGRNPFALPARETGSRASIASAVPVHVVPPLPPEDSAPALIGIATGRMPSTAIFQGSDGETVFGAAGDTVRGRFRIVEISGDTVVVVNIVTTVTSRLVLR